MAISFVSDLIFYGADMHGEYLAVHTPRTKDYLALLEPGKRYTVDIKEYRQKRSLDANAYAWVLIDRIAAAVGVTKAEVYRNAIREIGGVSDIVCVQEKAVDALCAGWRHNGLGWFAEQMPSKIPGCVNVTLYYGSSVYDTAQMSRLIDNLIQDAKALNIETMTPAELARLEGYDAERVR